MSKARHKFAKGGKPEIDLGREKDEENREEDDSKNKGGRVTRKKGGSVEMGEGDKPKMMRMDRPGRKRGGGVGANLRPLSTANNTKDAEGHKTGESGEARQNPEDG